MIEGPVWDHARGLYFSDVINGGVHLLDRTGKITLAVPKRRGIGGMALHESGGLVVGGRDIACVSLAELSTQWEIAVELGMLQPNCVIEDLLAETDRVLQGLIRGVRNSKARKPG